MFFISVVNKKCDTTDLFLSSKAIDFVQETKYLGVMLNSQLKTSIDVNFSSDSKILCTSQYAIVKL